MRWVLLSALVLLASGLPASWTSKYPSITCSAAGLTAPPPLCSAADPCTDLLALYAPLTSLNVSDTLGPATDCRTSLTIGANARNDGPMRTVTVGATTRYYCSSDTPGTGLPLVLFFPGSGGTAASIYNSYQASFPGLRQLADSYLLKPGVTGYLFVSVHPRNHHWPSLFGQDGAKNDFVFRNPANEDVVFVDQLIDSLVASGKVDARYIFIIGWSNGCQMGQVSGVVCVCC